MRKNVIRTILAMMLFAVLFTTATIEAKAANGGLTVSGLKKDGTEVLIESYDSFEEGWNKAMEYASDSSYLKKNSYAYISVDLMGDWNAVDGQFTGDFFNGKGFNWDAIYIPGGAKVVLNMNGYTIDRGLTDDEKNGEVMYVDKNAEVIINGDNGTIAGGYSNNGAGGIHINGAKVTLNDVCVSNNNVEDDDGAAIAVYKGTLVMNGGVISGNAVYQTSLNLDNVSGAVYAEASNVTLNSVELFENKANPPKAGSGIKGVVLSGREKSKMVMENCKIYDNQYSNVEESQFIAVFDSTLSMKNCQMYGNNNAAGGNRMELITVSNKSASNDVTISEFEFFDNNVAKVFAVYDCKNFNVTNSKVYDNAGSAVYAHKSYDGKNAIGGKLKNCTFSNNGKALIFDKEGLTFESCDLGDSTFENKQNATFIKCTGDGIGSLFGTGSAPMLIVMVVVIAAAAGASVVVMKKRRAAEAK